MSRALPIILLAALVWWLWPERALRHRPGILAPVAPLQQDIPPKSLGERHGYQIEARAAYALHARVLHTKRYWADHNDLVPDDIALGWGRMSDQAVLDRLKISQGNRFFFYQWRDAPPIPADEIMRSAANVHIIAANRTVARAVRKLRAGQLVAMRGYLVNVSGPKGFHWNTSLTRDDTGHGACELFYVEELRVAKTLPTSQSFTAR